MEELVVVIATGITRWVFFLEIRAHNPFHKERKKPRNKTHPRPMFPNMLVFKIWHSIPGLFFLCCTVKWRSLFHFPFPSPLPAGMYRRTLKRERGERCHVDSCEDVAFVLSLLVDYRVKTDVSSLYNTLYGLSKHKENSTSAECTKFHPRLTSSLSSGSFVAVDTLISILYPKSHNMTIQNLLGFCFHYKHVTFKIL